LIPTGWVYQWVAETVIGDPHVVMDQRMAMDQNGWKPVAAERHDGVFLPAGSSGAIRRGGLVLCERPKALQDEALAEERAKANQLMADRNASVGLDAKRAMPQGFEMGGKYRGTQPQVNISIDQGADIPRPKLDVAND
jgi:hypothetical protein